jgi:hypothetical protein
MAYNAGTGIGTANKASEESFVIFQTLMDAFEEERKVMKQQYGELQTMFNNATKVTGRYI